ncbi:MAG: hypothetical protein U5R31_17145 [Acidimicrobiia bacterium]|nr:hypothetical protein [Acidimicrobiia bacterium]
MLAAIAVFASIDGVSDPACIFEGDRRCSDEEIEAFEAQTAKSDQASLRSSSQPEPLSHWLGSSGGRRGPDLETVEDRMRVPQRLDHDPHTYAGCGCSGGAMNWARQIVTGLAAVDLVVTLVFLLAVDLGGTVSGTIHPVSVLFALWWVSPMVLLLVFAREAVTAAMGGAVLLAMSVGYLVAIFQDEHSTAAIGFATVPILMYVVAGVTGGVGWLVLRRREVRG